MKKTALFLLVTALLVLAACAGPGGQKITDFSDRSVGYGWLDIKDVDANRLNSVIVYQHRPQTSEPYYHVKVVPFQEGFLYYSFAFPNGAFKTYSAEGQKCFGLCGNTVYSYEFGKQGDQIGAVKVEEPGIYNFGAYKLAEVKTGFFEQGKFDIQPAQNAPSRKEILEEILKDAQEFPQVAQRIELALRQ